MSHLSFPSVQPKVQVWIYRWNATAKTYLFLLLKTQSHRGEFWQPVTGSVDPGEGLEEAAMREAKEETGLSFSEVPIEVPYSFEFDSRGKRILETGFSLRVTKDEPVLIDSSEHSTYQWVTSNQAFQMLGYSSNAKMLKSLLDRLEKEKA